MELNGAIVSCQCMEIRMMTSFKTGQLTILLNMSVLRKRHRSVNQESAPHITLDQFKQSSSNVIDFANFKSQRSSKAVRHKKISYGSNSIILAMVSSHLYDMIASRNVETLLGEFEEQIPLKLFKSVPSQFNKHLDSFSIRYVLRNLCQKIAQAKEEVAEAEVSKIMNEYPFFRVCLVLWARTKALKYLELYQHEFQILLGNQRETLMDLSQQLRYIALDVLCKSFSLKLTLVSESATEICGQAADQSKEMIIVFGPPNQSAVYVEDLTRKDMSTTITQNSVEHPTLLKVPNKHIMMSDVVTALSPRSNQATWCHKCHGKLRFGRCFACKQESTERLKKAGKFEHYVSMLKVCQECGKKQIIYRGELCRKCEAPRPI